MVEYLYRCGKCGVAISVRRRMGQAPLPEDLVCPQCDGSQIRRIFLAVPIHFIADGFTRKGAFDRPDERLKKEIAHSMDFDSVTGESWEDQDKRLDKRMAHWGHRMRKDIVVDEIGREQG